MVVESERAAEAAEAKTEACEVATTQRQAVLALLAMRRDAAAVATSQAAAVEMAVAGAAAWSRARS